jgi:hypothetical protein
MKILFDENYGQNKVKKLLEARGHDVGQISKSALKSSPDERVVELAVEEERIIITRDKDYRVLHDQDSLAPFGLLFVTFYDQGVKIKQYLVERIAWTIDHISKNPEWLANPDGLVDLKQPTPYGEWKIHWQGDKAIIEGLLHIVDHGVQLSEHVKVEGHLHIVDHGVQLSEHVELKAVPADPDE